MSEVREAAPEPATAGAWAWTVSRPWWVQVLAVYAAARLFTTVVFLWVASVQEQNPWTAEHPDYFPYVGFMFDGSWYRNVAENGYPAELPRGENGLVQQNAWAFFPLFPMLARGLMQLTGGSWDVVAPLLALVLGAGAVLAIHQTVVRGAPRAVAARPGLPLASVALVSVFPTAAVLQVAYTEALALLLIASALLLLIRRDYGWMALVVVALGFTRAVALPMAAVVVVHAAVRWWSARRGTDTWTWRTGVGLGALTLLSAASGFLWPAICGWATGVPDGVPADAGGVARRPRGRTVRRLVLRAAVLVRPARAARGGLRLRARDRGARRARRLAPGQRAARMGRRLHRLHRRGRRAGQQPRPVPPAGVPPRCGHRRCRHAASGGPAVVVRRGRRPHARAPGAVGPADVARQPGGRLAAVTGRRPPRADWTYVRSVA